MSRPAPVTIVIPAQPAYAFNPNSRKHWRVKHREAQDLKQWAIIVCLAKCLDPIHGPVDLHWTIRLAKGRKKLDVDNMTACIKPAQDGLVAAGVIDGDSSKVVRTITVDQVTWGTHKGQPEIEVRITPAKV